MHNGFWQNERSPYTVFQGNGNNVFWYLSWFLTPLMKGTVSQWILERSPYAVFQGNSNNTFWHHSLLSWRGQFHNGFWCNDSVRSDKMLVHHVDLSPTVKVRQNACSCVPTIQGINLQLVPGERKNIGLDSDQTSTCSATKSVCNEEYLETRSSEKLQVTVGVVEDIFLETRAAEDDLLVQGGIGQKYTKACLATKRVKDVLSALEDLLCDVLVDGTDLQRKYNGNEFLFQQLWQ
ncbi:hypothetical protein F4604DRAFT_1682241 [Suillus subluteus]|nr:hypothetical protein F4604DRAFT_1682241 [Suillus subluteus]